MLLVLKQRWSREFLISQSGLRKNTNVLQANSVTFTKEGEIDVRVENSSRVRSWVTAKMHYKVGGLKEAPRD